MDARDLARLPVAGISVSTQLLTALFPIHLALLELSADLDEPKKTRVLEHINEAIRRAEDVSLKLTEIMK